MDEYRRQRLKLLAAKPEGELTVEERLELLEGYLSRSEDRQRRSLILFGVFVALMALVAIVFVAKHGTDVSQSNKIDAVTQNSRSAICGVANNLALAFREPVPGESTDHFLDRMQAQLVALQAANGLHCADIPGLDNYGRHRREAFAELRAVLGGVNEHSGRGEASDGARSGSPSPGAAPQTPVAPASPTSPGASSASPPSPHTGHTGTQGEQGPQGGDVTVTTTTTGGETTTGPGRGDVEQVTHGVGQTLDDVGGVVDCLLKPQNC